MNDFRALGDPEFEISRRGYDREQVDADLAEVRAELARLQSQLTEAAVIRAMAAIPSPSRPNSIACPKKSSRLSEQLERRPKG